MLTTVIVSIWQSFTGTFARAAEPVARDWRAHPAVVEVKTEHDIYALGDVHGDCERMLQLLGAAGVIAPVSVDAEPGKLAWTAKHATLVCTGDVIDKYPQSYRAIQCLRAIEASAAKAGGRVIVTLGNHEAEFLAGDGDNKKAVELAKELQERGLSPADVAAGRDRERIGAWLRDLPVAAKVNGWFFCHAGNTGGRSVAELSRELEREIWASGFGAPILSDANSILEARLHPRPWWEAEEGVEIGEKRVGGAGERRLRANVAALGCEHLVMGHQPVKVKFGDGVTRGEGEIVEHFRGLVFLIDTGMSRGVNAGKPGMLKVHVGERHDRASVIDETGKVTEIWAGDR